MVVGYELMVRVRPGVLERKGSDMMFFLSTEWIKRLRNKFTYHQPLDVLAESRLTTKMHATKPGLPAIVRCSMIESQTPDICRCIHVLKYTHSKVY